MSDLLQRLQTALAGRYRIERELGHGGMATVLLAEDLKHHRPVAIKILDPDVAAAIGPERFMREIETAARLTHPHIVPLHDSGAADGLLYYVMPHIAGQSLRQRLLREKQLPLDEALRLTREVADALDHAHRSGIVHRDIKPENILLESGHAMVADFGIARAIAHGAVDAHAATQVARSLTAAGTTVGTPAYMSPEQAGGSRDLDGRSDQYALACVLYEMLGGQPPFTGPTAESLIHQHLSVAPRAVTELRPTVPAAVATALQQALAKAPADRFATSGEFAAACARGEENGAMHPTPAEQRVPGARPATHRARWLALAGLCAVIAVVAVAAWQEWGPFSGLLHRTGTASPGKKAQILVADFDGPPDDPVLARAAKELVSATLDQSTVVATVPRDQVQAALELAGKPDTLRLTPELAHEIAYRSAVRVVLEGEVGRLGKRYTVTLRVSDVEDARQILTLTDVARSEDALIPMLTSMGKRICAQLGEQPGSIRSTREGVWPTATSSFEAYRRMSEAGQAYDQGDFPGALRLSRQAVIIDPEFGSAWGFMAFAHKGVGYADSALFALHEAMRHPRSITPAYRLYLEGVEAMWRGDPQRAKETFDRVARVYPRAYETAFALDNWKGILLAEGRVAAAHQVDQIVDSLGLTGSGQLSLSNRARLLIMMGRLAEARSTAEGVRGNHRLLLDLDLALASGRWDLAESLSTSLVSAAGGSVVLRLPILPVVQAAAARGEVSAVMSRLLAAERAQGVRGKTNMARPPRARTLLALMSGRPVPRPEPWLAGDTTASALITRGYMAAAAGETTLARRLLTQLRARSTTQLGAHGSTPEFIEASIAAAAGRWTDVVRLIAQPARDGSDHGYPISPIGERIGTPAERWLAAQAYERLGQPDSAVAMYLRMLGPDVPIYSLIGLVHPFVHQRLVLLYARMGRLEDAERHLAILERDVTRPDPDVRRLLDEARDAVRITRSMARAETRGP